MSQYTPLASGLERYGLAGRVTEEEYEEVLDYADSLGVEDYFWQQGDAAQESFVPEFKVKCAVAVLDVCRSDQPLNLFGAFSVMMA